MGRTPNSKPSHGLRLAALLLLGASTGAAFGRIFVGSRASLVLIGTATGAILLGYVLRRRHMLVALAVSFAGLLVMLGELVVPETTIVGIPTGRTLRSLAAALERVGADAAEAIPPVPPLDSLLAVSMIAVWSAAAAAVLLVIRAGSPLLGLLPPSALLGFTGLVNAEGAYPGFALIFFLAALGILFDSGLRQTGAWGPILPRGPTWYEAGGARRMALGTVAAVLLLPPFLPGFGSEALIDPGGKDRGISIRALVDIRPSLNRKEAVELFRVSAEDPAYWRLFPLDRFDGRFWTTTDPEVVYGQPVEAPGALAGAFSAPATTLAQRFEIRELGGRHLPAAYQPTFLDAGGSAARYDSSRGTVALAGETETGFRYDVVSQVVEPTPRDLDRQSLLAATSLPRQYTEVPGGLPPVIGRLARALTEEEPTPYRKILAIQNFLRTFTYDEKAPPGHGTDDLVHFLLESRRGYCEQFAGTMAVMLRLLGYPSRVAVGFLPGEIGDDGWFHVTTHQAHSWVEVYFPSYGWLAFEPTPTRRNPSARGYALILGTTPGDLRIFPSEFGFLGNPGGAARSVGGRPGFTLEPIGVAQTADTPNVVEQERTLPWLPLAGGAVLVALIAAPAARAVRRALQRSRARTPRDGVLAWYRFFEERASDLGYGRGASETLGEYRRRLTGVSPIAEERLEKMIALTESAAYSARMLAAEHAREAAGLVRSLLRELRSHLGLMRAVAGSLRLTALHRS